jgi:hypothetical protein
MYSCNNSELAGVKNLFLSKFSVGEIKLPSVVPRSPQARPSVRPRVERSAPSGETASIKEYSKCASGRKLQFLRVILVTVLCIKKLYKKTAHGSSITLPILKQYLRV